MNTATSIEQSRKLLSLGIDPETADMYWCDFIPDEPFLCLGKIPRDNETGEIIDEKDVPAWSLSALCELMPESIKISDGYDHEYYVFLEFRKECRKWHVTYAKSNFNYTNPDLFVACIDLIERLMEQGYIKTKKKEQ